MAKECLQKRNQFLLLLLLRNQGKVVNAMMIYIVHVYYSKHGASDVEHFEMPHNHIYDKELSAQKQGVP